MSAEHGRQYVATAFAQGRANGSSTDEIVTDIIADVLLFAAELDHDIEAIALSGLGHAQYELDHEEPEEP